MFCANCGFQIKHDVNYCPNCGTDLTQQQELLKTSVAQPENDQQSLSNVSREKSNAAEADATVSGEILPSWLNRYLVSPVRKQPIALGALSVINLCGLLLCSKPNIVFLLILVAFIGVNYCATNMRVSLCVRLYALVVPLIALWSFGFVPFKDIIVPCWFIFPVVIYSYLFVRMLQISWKLVGGSSRQEESFVNQISSLCKETSPWWNPSTDVEGLLVKSLYASWLLLIPALILVLSARSGMTLVCFFATGFFLLAWIIWKTWSSREWKVIIAWAGLSPFAWSMSFLLLAFIVFFPSQSSNARNETAFSSQPQRSVESDISDEPQSSRRQKQAAAVEGSQTRIKDNKDYSNSAGGYLRIAKGDRAIQILAVVPERQADIKYVNGFGLKRLFKPKPGTRCIEKKDYVAHEHLFSPIWMKVKITSGVYEGYEGWVLRDCYYE